MTLALDHLVVTARTLEEGTTHVEAALGVPLSDIGRHDRMGTHNRLLSLGPEVYFEVIAIDPDAPAPDHARWYDLGDFDDAPRLTHWACRTDDLDAALATAPKGTGTPMAFARGDFRWRMAVPETGKLPYEGAMPALIQWDTDAHPAPRLSDHGVRLRQLRVEHPDATRLVENMVALARLPGVSIAPGPTKAMAAEFDTPSGPRVLA